jgi:hypothetical protein
MATTLAQALKVVGSHVAKLTTKQLPPAIKVLGHGTASLVLMQLPPRLRVAGSGTASVKWARAKSFFQVTIGVPSAAAGTSPVYIVHTTTQALAAQAALSQCIADWQTNLVSTVVPYKVLT